MTATAILSASGIYAIRNMLNGKVYVGSAVSIESRFKRHRVCLRGGNHHSLKLQRAWNKYGPSAFPFDAIENTDKSLLIDREQYWIDELGAYGDSGYNMIPLAANHFGAKRGLEASARMSAGQIGRRHSAETRAKIGLAQALRVPATAQTRAKISAANSGKKRSPEAIASMVAAQRRFVESGKKRPPLSDETRKKLSEAGKGRTHSIESIKKMAAAKMGKKRQPLTVEWAAKISAGLLGRKHSQKSKDKLSNSIRQSKAFSEARKILVQNNSMKLLVHGVEYSSIAEAIRSLRCGRPAILKLIDAKLAMFL